MPTLLALGAHYDDCVFGIPGIMLKAIRKNYRVVIVSLIGDYTNWPPVEGRAAELLEGTQLICRQMGAEMRYLGFKSHDFNVTAENKRLVAEAIADVDPDVAFLLWRDDHHEDHVVASQLSKAALNQGGAILRRSVKRARDLYYYDNGPGHTIGFEPDTYVDVTDEWPRALEWLGRFNALVADTPYDAQQRHPAQRTKEIIAEYRGKACGAQYAEAIRGVRARQQEIL